MRIHSLLINNSYVLSGNIFLSYLLFYTAYNKNNKELDYNELLNLLLFKYGSNKFLVEMNKITSLSGITIVLTSFLREFEDNKKELQLISLNLLYLHSVYSFYKFYKLKLTNIIKDKLMKRLSIALGMGAQFALSLGYFEQFSSTILAVSTTVLSIGHFYTMEIDYNYVLQVRPYAYLPFPIALYALYQNLICNCK